MQTTAEQTFPEVGHFDFQVCGAGRAARHLSTRFQVRCDAIGLNDNEILLLSIIGPETSVKALTAGLRASGKAQQRIDYAVEVGDVNCANLVKSPDGYRLQRTKLDYGLWHVLCISRRDGFMPVLTEETVWQELQSERFTTPLLREWMPWLYWEMKT